MNLGDTIAAIATAAGDGAVAMVRVSGPRARAILASTFRPTSGRAPRPRRLTHGLVVNPVTGAVVDEAVVAWLPAPRTYTREPVVEVTCHGGRAATSAVFQALLEAGARPAEPGEFTLRAFLHGRIDLAQAEAVRDAVAAPSSGAVATAVAQAAGALSRVVLAIREPLADLAAQIEGSLDFADDGVPDVDRAHARHILTAAHDRLASLLATAGPGRVRRHGLRVVLAGETNAGKSTLFNALVGSDRAIISDEAGTTRDVIEEVVAIGGVAIVFVDTAGWRAAGVAEIGAAERAGVARTDAAVGGADVVLHVVDGTAPRGLARRSDDSSHELPSAVDAQRGFAQRLPRTTAHDVPIADVGRARIAALAPGAITIEVRTRADLSTALALDASADDAGAVRLQTQAIGGGASLGVARSRLADAITQETEVVAVSGVTGQGIAALQDRLHAIAVTGGRLGDGRIEGEILTNARHVAALGLARDAVVRAIAVVDSGLADDLLAQDVGAAVRACNEVTGASVDDDVLSRVFRTFCIGK